MTAPLDLDAIERNITGFSHTRFEIYADPDDATADIWAVTEDVDDPYVIASDVERHIAESIVARLNFAPALVARVRELEAEKAASVATDEEVRAGDVSISDATIKRAREIIAAASPPPYTVGTFAGDNHDGHVALFTGMLALAPDELKCRTVVIPSGDTPIEEFSLSVAITGNGPTSEANALYIKHSHDPVGGWTLRRVTQAEADELKATLAASIACPRCRRSDLTVAGVRQHVDSCLSHTDEDYLRDEVNSLRAKVATMEAVFNAAVRWVTGRDEDAGTINDAVTSYLDGSGDGDGDGGPRLGDRVRVAPSSGYIHAGIVGVVTEVGIASEQIRVEFPPGDEAVLPISQVEMVKRHG